MTNKQFEDLEAWIKWAAAAMERGDDAVLIGGKPFELVQKLADERRNKPDKRETNR